MAPQDLSDPNARNEFLRQAVLVNVNYWHEYMTTNAKSVSILDREWEAIIKAILLGFDLGVAWQPIYQLIKTATDYMERRGYWSTWEIVLTKAISIAEQAKDRKREIDLRVMYTRLMQRQSRFNDVVQGYRKIIRLARQTGDRFNQARAYTNLGYRFVQRHLWYRAEVLCCRALAYFEALDNDHGRAHTENHLGFLYTRQHRFSEAQEHLLAALTIWRKMGDQNGIMTASINLSLLNDEMNLPNEALAYLEKARQLATEIGEEAALGTIYLNFGNVYQRIEQFTEAEDSLLKAEFIYKKFSSPESLARVWGEMGELYLAQGRNQKALARFEAALEAWQQLEDRYQEVRTHLFLVQTYVALQEKEQAFNQMSEVERLVTLHTIALERFQLQDQMAQCRRLLNLS